MPPKRKRATGNDGPRPSPHRPAETTMGSRDAYHDSPGRGGGGGGRGGRNPRRNDRRDSSQQHHGGQPHHPNNNQRPSSPAVPRQQHQQPPTPTKTAPPQPVQQQQQQPPQETQEPPVLSHYPYELLTDDKIAAWKESARQSIIQHGIQSRQDVDVTELTNIFQEFIYAVGDRRLNATDAGHCVKEIVGSESKEIIKDSFSYEPHRLFLDTLSIIDNDGDAYSPALREFLIAVGISPALMRQSLDAPLLQKLGLIRDSFSKMGVRHATNLLYRQANYNLLREETEGYSKLLTELFTSFAEAPSTDVPSTEVARALFEKVKALIGTFDLDVGRVLDVFLDVCATSLVKASKFFVKLLRISSWWPRNRLPPNTIFAGGLPFWAQPDTEVPDQDAIAELIMQRDIQFWGRAREKRIQAWFELGGRQVTDEELENGAYLDRITGDNIEQARSWMETTKTLPPQGNRVAAHLLGFKLRYYASDHRDGEVLPANLLYLAALLIKIGFISIVDLYPHLWPKDDEMEDYKTEKMKEVEAEERRKRGGGQPNALLMAGALSEESAPGQPAPSTKSASQTKTAASGDTSGEKSQAQAKPLEQKAALIISLLTVGALPEALYLIGRWPWLMEAFPDINDRLNRVLEYSIDKIYQESRPSANMAMECPTKKVADGDQTGLPKGEVRLTQIPHRKHMRWPYPDGRQGTGDQPYRFFWDDWADNVPVCQTLDDFFTLCDTFLKVSGPHIGRSCRLYEKLLSIGAKSLAVDKSQKNFDRWEDLLARVLVPALSTTTSSPSASNSLWSLLKLYPSTTRYHIYAEWFEGPVSRQPSMKTAFARTRAETQSVMKRVSNKNMTDSAKTLAKASHSSPGIVCRVALDQISSYANLTDAMVECCKYFTDLSKDVLVWSLLVALASNQRSRTQASYILSVSAWLIALSGFAGKVFRRYKELDATPILQYVNHQLFNGNSTDLIILEELILSMGGIVKAIDITDDQVMAMSGLSKLQRHTLLIMRDNRFESTRSSQRLMQALIDSRLAGRILVNMAQFRQSASFRLADDGAHIKFLSNMIDNSHQIFVQYLDLLRFNMTPEAFDQFVPGIGQLMVEFGLEAALAFMIGRESLSYLVFAKAVPSSQTKAITQPPTDKEGDVSMNEGTGDASASKEQSNSPPAETKTDSPPASSSSIFDAVQPVVESIKPVLAPVVGDKISAEFFVIFWTLQLRDILVPWQSYQNAQKRREAEFKLLLRDRSDMSKAATEKREAQRNECTEEMSALQTEAQKQREHVARAKIHMTKSMPTWFSGDMTKLNGASDAFIEQCLLPRLVISKSDTEYAYALIKLLHEMSCPNFRLKVLYDRLFNANRIRIMLFTCTVREAELLGRFFHHVLRDLTRWHKDSSTYTKEAIGKTTSKPNGRPGFADKFGEDGQPSSHIEHAQFRSDLFGWHKSLNVALKSCLGGTEWMHIRNAISFLSAVHEFFPAIDFMGEQLYKQLVEVGEREEHTREDLSTLANGALSVLARKRSSWVKVQAFRTNVPVQDSKETQKAASTSLRPNAPAFKPRGHDEAEDGEVKDGARGKTQVAGSQRQTPSQQDTSRNSPAISTSQRDSTKPAAVRPRAAAATANEQPSTPKPTATESNQHTRQAAATNNVSNQNRHLPKAPPGLPARPTGPIPENVPNQGRYGGPQTLERRDTRGRERDTRDARSTDQAMSRPERSREPTKSEPRASGRESSGRPAERDTPSRPDSQTPRTARDNIVESERPNQNRSRTPDTGRQPREVLNTTNPTKGEEPPMNPARAALIQGDQTERPPRHDRSDRSKANDNDRRGGRGHQAAPETPEQTGVNHERSATFNDARAPRDEPRDRGRGSPSRRSGRHDAASEAPRDDRGRPHGRDHRGDVHAAPGPRDDRPGPDPTRDAFLGSRGPEGESDRKRQDETYGRLNQIPSVADPPSGPRGRGSARSNARNNNANTPTRFPHGEPPHGAHSEDRHPPTGPASGRGRQGQGQGQSQGPAPASTPTPGSGASAPDRMRQTPSNTPVSSGKPQASAPPGVHPDRLRQIGGSPAPNQGQQGPRSQGGTPTGGPREQQQQQQQNSMPAPPAPDFSAPTGPSSSNERRRTGGRRQLEGINSTLQQAQATMPEPPRNNSSRSRNSRQNMAGSDAQILTGGSPVSTPAHERTNPMPHQEKEMAAPPAGPPAAVAGHGAEQQTRSEHDRRGRERSGRSSRRHSSDRDRERERDRDRERSPAREREVKEPRDYRERTSGHGSSSRNERERDHGREREREPRRSGREAHGNNPRASQGGGPPQQGAAQGSNSEPLGVREPRRRDGSSMGGRNEDRNGGGSMRGHPRGGPRDAGSGRPDDKRDGPRDDRRKRRSEDVSGLPNEKRPRH